ncbi:MAG: MFS transporter [Alphaproteobacteria bacterium]|nr:MFS transporter [Alphaproteobacteria bacterium]
MPRYAALSREEKKIIIASSVGTLFEWYDFFLYGSLAAIIAKQFFSNLDPASGFVFALLAFAAGFVVRPFGALIFGRLGDMVGRKYTFLVTIIIMGLATFAVGLLPSYDSIGIMAPIILITLRMLQGLALGGEYGGATIYVAEHAPGNRRGYFTSWIQLTASTGLVFSLLVILGVRTYVGEEAFAAWGWRLPFLLSFFLFLISLYIRLSMSESPAFKAMKEQGRTSAAPLRESFTKWRHLKYVLLALFGLMAGHSVAWYTANFYSLFFLTQSLKIAGPESNIIMAISILLAAPFYPLMGSLSDRWGRKRVILTGFLLMIISLFPTFHAITWAGNPALATAQQTAAVIVAADPAECSFQFNPTGTAKFTSSCDIAKQMLTNNAVSYNNNMANAGTLATITIGDDVISSYNAKDLSKEEAAQKDKDFKDAVLSGLKKAGYPEKADSRQINHVLLILLLTYIMVVAAMIYGPLAAALVELFPTRIRYSAMSLPYNIGTGWFGGLLPTIVFAMVAYSGNIYSGLWYPVITLVISLIVGLVFARETKDKNIYADD